MSYRSIRVHLYLSSVHHRIKVLQYPNQNPVLYNVDIRKHLYSFKKMCITSSDVQVILNLRDAGGR